jgi:hypothetical protein
MKTPTEIYSRILLEIERILGKDTETNNIELNELCNRIFGKKFVGVFSSDTIPKLKKNQSCIANLDDSSQPGSHWVAFYCNEHSRCYFYDSFGRSVKSFKNLQKRNKIMRESKDYDAEQEKIESNCGQRCISWICCCEILPIDKVLEI